MTNGRGTNLLFINSGIRKYLSRDYMDIVLLTGGAFSCTIRKNK